MTGHVADALDRLDLTGARDWLKSLSMFGPEHPATRGCLLALVREAWGLPGLYVQFRGGVSASVHAWLVVGPEDPDGKGGKVHVTGATEDEALVCALEAAPA